MRHFAIMFCLFFTCAFTVKAADFKMDAKLIGPEVIRLKDTTCSFWMLPYEVEFSWEKADPLEIDLYIIKGKIALGPYVDFELKDSEGKVLQVMSLMSMPSSPDGHLEIESGKKLRASIYAWNGLCYIDFSKNYSISAKISGKCKGKFITLTTQSLNVRFIKAGSRPDL